MRRALKFAIDRREVLDLLGAPATQPPTCQILPPNFQGYEPLCPYTLDPDSGVWSAPDLDAARARIAHADAAGERVTLWVSEASPSEIVDAMGYVVEVLKRVPSAGGAEGHGRCGLLARDQVR